MKLLFILLLTFSTVFAQDFSLSSFLGNQKSKPDPKKVDYSFITPPKGVEVGSYSLSCWLASGVPHPTLTNRRIKSYQIQVMNYIVSFSDNKKALVPVEHCFIIEDWNNMTNLEWSPWLIPPSENRMGVRSNYVL